MERWQGKVAVCTGASAGIGAAIVKSLVQSGMIVVGLARRQEKIEDLKKDLPANLAKNLHALKCDVSNESEIMDAFAWIEKHLGGVDVLINNAGILATAKLIDPENTSKIRNVLDVNVLGVVLCTREAFQSMKKRNVDGHIILINSIAGHKVPMIAGISEIPSLNIYPATKHAVTALTESLRQEFLMEKTKIKITSISPGAVRTEILSGTNIDTDASSKHPLLEPEDIAASILYALGTPKHVQVHELTIKPVGELF